jgi:hypothetical protein
MSLTEIIYPGKRPLRKPKYNWVDNIKMVLRGRG